VHVGLWQERIPPGRRTSFTHAHSDEEELIYVIAGECHARVVEPGKAAVEIAVRAGHCISFPAGTRIAHCFVNHGSADAVILCFGQRKPGIDRCGYPEDREYDAHRARTRPETHWPID
jgi:uncharacterized cupin superfamily protein